MRPLPHEGWSIASILNINEACTMPTTNIKQEAYRLVEQLPENATWDDLMYEIYVRQMIEAGLTDSEAGRTLDVKEVRAKFGLPA
jgi:hypothetical protein